MLAQDLAAQQRKAQKFNQLHRDSGCFIMPNAWDAGNAKLLAQCGFDCMGTTSAGIAFSLAKPDHQLPNGSEAVSRDEMLQRVSEICAAVELPVSADMESGYGATPEQVAQTISLSIQAGVVGANIEDYTGSAQTGLFSEGDAVARIRAARASADASAIKFTLNCRCDAFLVGLDDAFAVAVRRGNLFADAGADCVFIPGAADPATIERLVKEIDAPINVVMGLSGNTLTKQQLTDMGVRKISVGGSIARAAMGLIRSAAREMLDQGSFNFASGQIPQGELCDLFS